MSINLKRASVRPIGINGLAHRTENGSVLVCSADAVELIQLFKENAQNPQLINLLIAEAQRISPASLLLAFDANDGAYVLVYGKAKAVLVNSTGTLTMQAEPQSFLIQRIEFASTETSGTLLLELDASLSSERSEFDSFLELRTGTVRASALELLASVTARDEAQTESQPEAQPAVTAAASAAATAVGQAPPEAQPETASTPPESQATAPPPQAPTAVAPTQAHTPAAATPLESQAAAPPPQAPAPQATQPAAQLQTEHTAPKPAPASEQLPVALPPQDEDLLTALSAPTRQMIAGLDIPVISKPSPNNNQAEAAELPPIVPETPQAISPTLPSATQAASPTTPKESEPQTTPAEPDFEQVALFEPEQHHSSDAIKEATAAMSQVAGVLCENGHICPPSASNCRQCNANLATNSQTALASGARPPLGALRFDDSIDWAIRSDAIIGREATTHVAVTSGVAAAINLEDTTMAMSRHHARIELRDWHAVLADMGSSNGTYVSRDGGHSWHLLPEGKVMRLKTGDLAQIGGRIGHFTLFYS